MLHPSTSADLIICGDFKISLGLEILKLKDKSFFFEMGVIFPLDHLSHDKIYSLHGSEWNQSGDSYCRGAAVTDYIFMLPLLISLVYNVLIL